MTELVDSTPAGGIAAWASAHSELQSREAVSQLHQEVLNAIHVNRPATLILAEAAVALAEAAKDDAALALAWRVSGNAHYANDRYARAVDDYTRSLGLFEARNEQAEVGRTLNSALQSLAYLGRYDQAMEWAGRARRIFAEQGDELRLARLDTNLANLYYRRDLHEDAIGLYEGALSAFRRVGRASDVAAVLSNIAVCRTSLGKFNEALDAYREVRSWCETYGLSQLVAEADYNIAWLFHLRGDYVRAMELYARTRTHCEQVNDAYHLALCDLDEAEMYLELNLTEEGAELARRASAQFEKLGMGYEQARSLVCEAMAMADQGAKSGPQRLFERARALFVAQGNRIWPALIDLYGSVLARRRGNNRRGLSLCRRASRVLSGSLLPGKAALCELIEAQLLLDRGDCVRARELAFVALGRLELSETQSQRVTAFSLLARIEEDAGREHSALEFWERARKEAETLRSRLWGESPRIAFMKDKLAVYESLARLYLKRGNLWSAFSAVEQAKSRSMAELLTDHNVVPLDPATSEALRDLNATYRQLETAGLTAGEAPEPRARELRDRLGRKEREVARRIAGLRSKGLSVSPEMDEMKMRASIPPDTLLIEYFEIRGVIHACLLSRAELHILPLVETAAIAAPLRYLQLQVGRMRNGAARDRLQAGTGARAAVSHLGELYQALIGPFRPLLGSYSRLVAMPSGQLHEVPFHALFDGERYLIDRYAVACAPSAQVFRLCESLPASRHTESLVMGIPDAYAPSIAEETAAVSEVLGARPFTGPGATPRVLREHGARSRFVHIATHGIFRRDNPLFSSIQLGDSRLSVLDLYRLHLKADLVTLSGCSTGLNAVVGGDEIMGLIRGVLFAGARSVLASLWDVHDESTTEFMRAFYRVAVGGAPPVEALRRAIAEVREKWPHPYYWAPFLLVGAVT
ncbi:MAG: CHAT domain-containing protein [Acidobacteriota bacterium]|nr:CHAT domain-containing protein [Acidobacteriota bacterium]